MSRVACGIDGEELRADDRGERAVEIKNRTISKTVPRGGENHLLLFRPLIGRTLSAAAVDAIAMRIPPDFAVLGQFIAVRLADRTDICYRRAGEMRRSVP